MQGEEHPDVGQRLQQRGGQLRSQGRYAEAEPLFRKALAICRKVLGEEHPSTASSYNGVAFNLHGAGQICGGGEELATRPELLRQGPAPHRSFGLDRAAKTAESSPLPALSAVLIRNGKFKEAWQHFEESLARGTWDNLSARLRRPQAEQAKQAQLVTRLNRLDQLLTRLSAVKQPTPAQTQRRKELLTQRRQAQDELDAFGSYLEKTYGPAAGAVFERKAIQAALPPDAALLGWLDIAGTPKAHDPNGEHWAVLLRATGDPVFVRLKGSGRKNVWTDADSRLPAQLHCFAVGPRQLAAPGPTPAPATPATADAASCRSWQTARGQTSAGSTLRGPGRRARRGLRRRHHGQLRPVRYFLRPPPQATEAGLEKSAGPGRSGLRRADCCGAAAAGRRAADSGGAGFQRRPRPPPGQRRAAALRRHRLERTRRSGQGIVPIGPKGRGAGDRLAGRQDLRPPRPGRQARCGAGPRTGAEALAERRKQERQLAQALRGGGDDKWDALPGTRAEVEALRRLFDDKPRLLFDAQASEQRLDELAAAGELAKYRYLHFATHGFVDNRFPLNSAVILSRDALPDPNKQLDAGLPIYKGKLTVRAVLRRWHLKSELVTLSACQTALGKYERGEGFVGFAQALILAGSRSVCLSLWKVDDAATALLMERFYQNLLGKRAGLKQPLSKAQALAEAKSWLRGLSRQQALQRMAGLTDGVARGKGRKVRKLLPPLPKGGEENRPYAHPYYWAAFVLLGDPE